MARSVDPYSMVMSPSPHITELADRLQSILFDLVKSVHLSPHTRCSRLDLTQSGVYLLYSASGALLKIIVIEQGMSSQRGKEIYQSVGSLIESGLVTSYRRLDSDAAGLSSHVAMVLAEAIGVPVEGITEDTREHLGLIHTRVSPPVSSTEPSSNTKRRGRPRKKSVEAPGDLQGSMTSAVGVEAPGEPGNEPEVHSEGTETTADVQVVDVPKRRRGRPPKIRVEVEQPSIIPVVEVEPAVDVTEIDEGHSAEDRVGDVVDAFGEEVEEGGEERMAEGKGDEGVEKETEYVQRHPDDGARQQVVDAPLTKNQLRELRRRQMALFRSKPIEE